MAIKTERTAMLRPMKLETISIKIEGVTPLIQHAWSDKAKGMIRDKQAGKKTKNRDVRDPHKEFEDATYRTKKGGYAVPLMSIKNAIISAAHKDLGVEKTLVRKAIFLKAPDPNDPMMAPIECDAPVMREDFVRVGVGAADLRYRPQFDRWEAFVLVEYDTELVTVDDIVNLINRAGFGVGIGEWRPEKGGEFGRFRIAA